MHKQIIKIINSLKPYKPEKIILFGSAASGKFKKGWSDLDILIIKKTKEPFWQRQKKLFRLLQADFDVDAFILTPKEVRRALDEVQPFIYDIIHQGKVIYEKK